MSTCQWHCIKSRGNNQVFNQLAWSIDQKSNIQVFINSYDIVYFISGPGENLVRGWVTYFSWRWSWRCLWVCIWESKGGGKGTRARLTEYHSRRRWPDLIGPKWFMCLLSQWSKKGINVATDSTRLIIRLMNSNFIGLSI